MTSYFVHHLTSYFSCSAKPQNKEFRHDFERQFPDLEPQLDVVYPEHKEQEPGQVLRGIKRVSSESTPPVQPDLRVLSLHTRIAAGIGLLEDTVSKDTATPEKKRREFSPLNVTPNRASVISPLTPAGRDSPTIINLQLKLTSEFLAPADQTDDLVHHVPHVQHKLHVHQELPPQSVPHDLPDQQELHVYKELPPQSVLPDQHVSQHVRHDLPPQHVPQHVPHDLPDQHNLHVQQELPPQHVPKVNHCDFHTGGSNVKHTLYYGLEDCRNWDAKKLKTLHFLNPQNEAKTITIRAMVDCTMDIMGNKVVKEYASKQGIILTRPLLTFKGQPVNLENMVKSYSDNSMFLLVDGELPDHLRKHKGHIWECSQCHESGTQKKNITRKKLACQHTFLFVGNQLHTLGENKDRYVKPWACPDGHHGPLPEEQGQQLQPAGAPDGQDGPHPEGQVQQLQPAGAPDGHDGPPPEGQVQQLQPAGADFMPRRLDYDYDSAPTSSRSATPRTPRLTRDVWALSRLAKTPSTASPPPAVAGPSSLQSRTATANLPPAVTGPLSRAAKEKAKEKARENMTKTFEWDESDEDIEYESEADDYQPVSDEYNEHESEEYDEHEDAETDEQKEHPAVAVVRPCGDNRAKSRIYAGNDIPIHIR